MDILNLVRDGMRLAGKLIGDVSNSVTGGLTGKVENAISQNSGLVGKITGSIARAVPKNVRNALSTVADQRNSRLVRGTRNHSKYTS